MNVIYEMPGHLIRRLHQISISVFADKLKSLGYEVTPLQFAALSALARHPGIDQATLAGLIANDRPTTGGVIERLQAKGFIERERSPKDRRANVLRLSAAGQTLLDAVAPEVARFQADILPGLDEAERAEFIRLASKVAQAGNDLSRAPFVPLND